MLAAQLSSSPDNYNMCAMQWADHQWMAEGLEILTRLCTFIPDIGTEPPGMALLRTACFRLYRICTGPLMLDAFVPACANEVWPPLQLVSVAQKNKLSTMLSSNVQHVYPGL